jgi:hypothetical protein
MNSRTLWLDTLIGVLMIALLFWTLYVRRGHIGVGDVLVILSLVAFGFFLGIKVASR